MPQMNEGKQTIIIKSIRIPIDKDQKHESKELQTATMKKRLNLTRTEVK